MVAVRYLVIPRNRAVVKLERAVSMRKHRYQYPFFYARFAERSPQGGGTLGEIFSGDFSTAVEIRSFFGGGSAVHGRQSKDGRSWTAVH